MSRVLRVLTSPRIAPAFAAVLAIHLIPSPAPADSPRPTPTTYLEVPLKGGFGDEITAPGVRAAIRLAKQRKADAVVLILDTPGGRVMDAEAIAHVMDQEPDLTFYTVVVRAISAGVWTLSRSDRIFFAPGAAAGAAVAYTHDAGTGNIEVDAKFNAALAAQVSAAAEKRGQSGCVYRAMIVKDERVFRWQEKAGGIRLSGTRPAAPEAPHAVELDSDQTVLALTPALAAEIGFGTLLPSADAAAIGPLIGAPEWRSVGTAGVGAMNAGRQEVQRRARDTQIAMDRLSDLRQKVADLAGRCPALVTGAIDADPSKVALTYYAGTDTLTPGSRSLWRSKSMEATRQWNGVKALLEEIRAAEKKADRELDAFNTIRAREWEARLYKEAPEPVTLDRVPHGLDLEGLWLEADRHIVRLREDRVRYKIDR